MTMSRVAGGGMCGPKVFLVSENASDQRPATADLPFRQTASRVRCIAWLGL
jgi:hypothetical protein